MVFGNFEALLWLWLVPFFVVLWGLGLRRKQFRLRSYSPNHWKQLLNGEWALGRNIFKGILVSLALLAMVFALAFPRIGFDWRPMPQGGMDVMIALDMSTSMLATDISPNRIERAKREINDLLTSLNGDRVGIIAFAGVPFVQCPLTADYRMATMFVNQLNIDMMPVQGTMIGSALKLAIDSLEKATGASSEGRAIILITDGEDQGNDAMEMAKLAKEKGIKIFAVGIGDEAGAPIPTANGGFKKDRSGNVILSKLGEKPLEALAFETGGVYVRSSQSGHFKLDQIYEKGIKVVGNQDEQEAQRRQRVWHERFQWFLFLALGFLCVEFFIREYRFKTKAQ